VGSSVGLSLPSPGWDAYPELSGTAREQFKGSGSSHAGIFEPTNDAQMGSGEDRRRAVSPLLRPARDLAIGPLRGPATVSLRYITTLYPERTSRNFLHSDRQNERARTAHFLAISLHVHVLF
jgi:hypothetical protein